MDILSNFEKDQKMLAELKELLEFAPPGKLRRGLTDLFFHCFTEEDPALPNQQELITHFYYLINFLNEVEDHLRQLRWLNASQHRQPVDRSSKRRRGSKPRRRWYPGEVNAYRRFFMDPNYLYSKKLQPAHENALHLFTCIILLFLASCHCSGGPDVVMVCSAVDNSTIEMNNGRSYTQRTNPFLKYEKDDTLFIEYYKGDRYLNVTLFFQEIPSGSLELDTTRSFVSLLRNELTVDFTFIEYQLTLNTLTSNTCHVTYQYGQNMPDTFQATISGKVKSANEVREVVIEINVANYEYKSEEC